MQGSKIIQCGHCGKRAVFYIRGEGKKYGAILQEDPTYEGMNITTWRILECESCHQPTLEQISGNYLLLTTPYGSETTISDEQKILLYPVNRPTLTNLPKTIEKKYMDALSCLGSAPCAFAAMTGRTLEAVCNYEQMEGKTLAHKLEKLIRSERIPPTLAQMAQQLRQIRNLGAHDDVEDDVTEEDVPIILELL